MRHSILLLLIVPVTATAGCGGDGGGAMSGRELEATALVKSQTGDEVMCRDNGAVNSELAPEHPIGYSCFNESGEFYNIVVAPDGAVMSLSGPNCLQGGNRGVVDALGFENIPDCT